MKYLFVLAMLLSPTMSWAADWICTSVVLGRTQYLLIRSEDSTSPRIQECLKVPKAEAPAQRAIDDTVPIQYRKLVDMLLAEMTADEKTAADMPTAEEAAEGAKVAERETIIADPSCTATLPQMRHRLQQDAAEIQADIDAATNIVTAKTAMTTSKTKTFTLLSKIAECLLARTGGLQQ